MTRMGQLLNKFYVNLTESGCCSETWAEAITYALLPTVVVGLAAGVIACFLFLFLLPFWGW